MPKREKPKPVKVIVALCEGKTDVAFLRRLLKADNYNDYTEIVANMPKPFGFANGSSKGSYFMNKLAEYKYESKSLRDRPILPLILRRAEGQIATFLLLYDMNGMDRTDNYREIITDFKRLTAIPSNDDSTPDNNLEKGKPLPISLALAFIYDLDNESITNRIDYIKEKYTDLINELQYLSEDKPITNSQNFKAIGCHFLQKGENEGGNLEDIVLPLMQRGNEELFKSAEEFLGKNNFARHKGKGSSWQKDENKTESDFKKSLIGTVGQIEYSGLGNEDVIKLSSFLDKDKLKHSDQCQGIIAFFKKLRDALSSQSS